MKNTIENTTMEQNCNQLPFSRMMKCDISKAVKEIGIAEVTDEVGNVIGTIPVLAFAETKESWNNSAMESNRRGFVLAYGRPPVSTDEVIRYVHARDKEITDGLLQLIAHYSNIGREDKAALLYSEFVLRGGCK